MDFGGALKRLRAAEGLTQQEFADSLHGGFARSTIANIEAGREPPSIRLWAAITQTYPTAAEHLEAHFLTARHLVSSRGERLVQAEGHEAPVQQLGGPFVMERLDLTYVFRESRSPEEILELRTVKALRDGADKYVLKMKVSSTDGFTSTPEMLWGGLLADSTRSDAAGQTIYLRQVHFEPPLRRGDRHTFAMRSWVERDPEPDTTVSVLLTIPAQVVSIHLDFLGPRPARAWAYGPVADEVLRPLAPSDATARPLSVGRDGQCTYKVTRPSLGTEYGISWSWEP